MWSLRTTRNARVFFAASRSLITPRRPDDMPWLSGVATGQSHVAAAEAMSEPASRLSRKAVFRFIVGWFCFFEIMDAPSAVKLDEYGLEPRYAAFCEGCTSGTASPRACGKSRPWNARAGCPE